MFLLIISEINVTVFSYLLLGLESLSARAQQFSSTLKNVKFVYRQEYNPTYMRNKVSNNK